MDKSPLEILRLAENEEQACELAQVEISDDNLGSMVADIHSHLEIQGKTDPNIGVLIDDSWKESDHFSRLGWSCSYPNDGT